MASARAHDLAALCATCPSAEEVTSVLQGLGFTLTFHLDTVPSGCVGVPPLPAQYHFCDQCGSEVIYLAGHDANTDGVRLPDHASRFWIYPGADAGSARRVTHALAARWSLAWEAVSQARQDVA